jgi:hypothetical protein
MRKIILQTNNFETAQNVGLLLFGAFSLFAASCTKEGPPAYPIAASLLGTAAVVSVATGQTVLAPVVATMTVASAVFALTG